MIEEKKVKYFKFIDKKQDADCIFKYKKTKIEDPYGFYELKYELYLMLKKENGKYRRIEGCNQLISALKSSTDYINKEIVLNGNVGKPFVLENYKKISFRSRGIFTYLCSEILNDTIKLLDNPTEYRLHFPSPRLVYSNEFEKDKDNYIRRNSTYEKLGFKMKFTDEKRREGELLDTSVDELTLHLDIPECITYYENANNLISDAIELIPFANDKILKNNTFKISSFVTKEREINNAIFDVTKIIGTDHPRYYNLTWEKMLKILRTPDYIKQLSLNEDKEYGSINFYKRKRKYDLKDDPWGIYVYNDKAFISEGNHRTIISKFLHALELIDKDMTGLKYVTYFDVDYVECKRFWALKRWLKIYYPFLEINIKARRTETDKIEKEQETISLYKTTYEQDLNFKTIIIEDGKEKIYHNIKSFETIEILEEYLKNEILMAKKQFFFKVSILNKFLTKKIAPILNTFNNKFNK